MPPPNAAGEHYMRVGAVWEKDEPTGRRWQLLAAERGYEYAPTRMVGLLT